MTQIRACSIGVLFAASVALLAAAPANASCFSMSITNPDLDTLIRCRDAEWRLEQLEQREGIAPNDFDAEWRLEQLERRKKERDWNRIIEGKLPR